MARPFRLLLAAGSVLAACAPAPAPPETPPETVIAWLLTVANDLSTRLVRPLAFNYAPAVRLRMFLSILVAVGFRDEAIVEG